LQKEKEETGNISFISKNLHFCILDFETAKAVAGNFLFVLHTTINCGAGSICSNTMIYHGACTIEN